MSRQASFETDITVKNYDALKDAVTLTCEDLEGQFVESIRYHAGKVLGIRVGYKEVGIVVDEKGKVTLVGEDISVNDPEFRQKVISLLKKNYVSESLGRTLSRFGYRVNVTRAKINKVKGVRIA